MKTVLVSLAAAGLLASSAFASSEPRCWYGQNAPACREFQRTDATNLGGGLKSVTGNGEREFDHERETTRPY